MLGPYIADQFFIDLQKKTQDDVNYEQAIHQFTTQLYGAESIHYTRHETLNEEQQVQTFIVDTTTFTSYQQQTTQLCAMIISWVTRHLPPEWVEKYNNISKLLTWEIIFNHETNTYAVNHSPSEIITLNTEGKPLLEQFCYELLHNPVAVSMKQSLVKELGNKLDFCNAGILTLLSDLNKKFHSNLKTLMVDHLSQTIDQVARDLINKYQILQTCSYGHSMEIHVVNTFFNSVAGFYGLETRSDEFISGVEARVSQFFIYPRLKQIFVDTMKQFLGLPTLLNYLLGHLITTAQQTIEAVLFSNYLDSWGNDRLFSLDYIFDDKERNHNSTFILKPLHQHFLKVTLVRRFIKNGWLAADTLECHSTDHPNISFMVFAPDFEWSWTECRNEQLSSLTTLPYSDITYELDITGHIVDRGSFQIRRSLGQRNFENLTFEKTDFSHLDLRDVRFNICRFNDIKLHGCRLSEEVFTALYQAGVRNFEGADLRKVTFTAPGLENNFSLHGVRLSLIAFNALKARGITHFADCNFSNVDLTTADFSTCTLSNPCLQGCTLTPLQFKLLYDAGLRDFYGVKFTDILDCTGMDLREVNFLGCRFPKIILTSAHMSRQTFIAFQHLNIEDFFGANFSDADLRDIDFTGCNVTDVILAGAQINIVSFHSLLQAGAKNFNGIEFHNIYFGDLNYPDCCFQNTALHHCTLTIQAYHDMVNNNVSFNNTALDSNPDELMSLTALLVPHLSIQIDKNTDMPFAIFQHLYQLGFRNFSEVCIDFSGEDLTDLDLASCRLARVNITNTKLSQKNFKDLYNAGFRDFSTITFLEQLNCLGMDLRSRRFHNCNFNVGIQLQSALLNAQVFQELYVSGIRDFSNADFTGADLREINFCGCNFSGIKIQKACLSNQLFTALYNRGFRDFYNVNLNYINFTRLDLKTINLSLCNFAHTLYGNWPVEYIALATHNPIQTCKNLLERYINAGIGVSLFGLLPSGINGNKHKTTLHFSLLFDLSYSFRSIENIYTLLCEKRPAIVSDPDPKLNEIFRLCQKLTGETFHIHSEPQAATTSSPSNMLNPGGR